MRTATRILLASAVVAFAGFAGGVDDLRIRVVDEQRPPVLDRLGDLQDLTALDIAGDGQLAMIAREVETKPHRSRVYLYSTATEEPRELDLHGRVHALMFDPDSASVLAVQFKKTRHRPGVVYLLRITIDPFKARQVMRLPVSTRGLDTWIERGSLLLAARDSIRTLSLPDLRSGPLFRVPGENLAVASMGGGSLILVGQSDGLLLVDLDDPSEREGLPVRDRLGTSSPVVDLAPAADGSRALARLEDGTVVSVVLSPLRIEEVGRAIAVTSVAGASGVDPAERPAPSGEPTLMEEPVGAGAAIAVSGSVSTGSIDSGSDRSPPLDEQPTSDAARPPVETVPEETTPRVESGADAAEVVPEETTPPVESGADAAEVVPEETTPPVESGADAAEVVPEETTPPVGSGTDAADAAPAKQGNDQLRGRIEGDDLAVVRAVVLFGPDNFLREASRVVPSSDGSWSASGLRPGRYRVQLDGGGTRVIVTDPAFVLVNVVQGKTSVAPALRLRGEY